MKQEDLIMRTNYLVLASVIVLLLSGCGNIYLPLKEKTRRDDLRIGIVNHSESSIYIESVGFDRSNSKAGKQILGLLNCSGKYNVNGPDKTMAVPLDMDLPDKVISVQWYSIKQDKTLRADLHLPGETGALIYRPPWFNAKGQRHPFSVLYIDIKESNNVWLRLAAGDRDINDRKDVMILSKSKGYISEGASSYDSLRSEGVVNCLSEADKVRNIADKLSISENKVIFDDWYPGATEKSR